MKLADDIKVCQLGGLKPKYARTRRDRVFTEQERIEACSRVKSYARALPQFAAAKAAVTKRTGYGLRVEKAPRAGCHKLAWSNAGRAWDVYASSYTRGTPVTLDANEILACGTLRDLNAIALALPPLPLYGFSYEGRTRAARGRRGVN